ncbi:transposase [Streptomyces griseoruber]|uniref:transposase n=1 Tax=Streptomyces griseoruber TaxID=1943 RepID=UPI00379C2285
MLRVLAPARPGRVGAGLVGMQGEWAEELVGPDVWETCRELIPVGSVFAFLAEHREVLFPPGMFADMYPSANGRPSLPPQVLAATVVLQSLQGLSDFETVQELRCDLRWKAACGLGLYDTAFAPSLLTYFRRRLRHSADPTRIFTKVKEVVAAAGVLKGRQRRALDSTVLDDAVATQDTVTQSVSAIRRVIREVPGAQFKRVCTGCPLRERCTTSRTGRTLNVHPQCELLAAARAQAATDTLWPDEYRRWRPPVSVARQN